VGSAAANAGIKAGDIIVAVDGQPTPDLNTLAAVLASHQPGEKVKVDLRRADGSSGTVDLTLDELAG
jgi:putative serine protease PepD